MRNPRSLRYLAAGAAAGALALGSVGAASAQVGTALLGNVAETVGGVIGTAPLVGEGGLLDDTVIVAKADVNVPNVAHVRTADAVVIDDGEILVATKTHANVADVVKADVKALAVVDTQDSAVGVIVFPSHVEAAGVAVDATVAPATVDLRHLTIHVPFAAARLKVGDLVKAKVKASAFVDLPKGKIKVKAKVRARVAHLKIRARAHAKVKLHRHVKVKIGARAIVR
jgi:hypothetical protein